MLETFIIYMYILPFNCCGETSCPRQLIEKSLGLNVSEDESMTIIMLSMASGRHDNEAVLKAYISIHKYEKQCWLLNPQSQLHPQ